MVHKMLQNFNATANPKEGPARLTALRKLLIKKGVNGYIVPRSDMYQGEYVAPCDERLQWLTGFSGSAGFAVVLENVAGVFIDGRYRTQVKEQVDLKHFTPVAWPEISLSDWLRENAKNNSKIGFDPWLHTIDEIEKVKSALKDTNITLVAVDNMIDPLWSDRPESSQGMAFSHSIKLAGVSRQEKCKNLAHELQKRGEKSALITLPDSLCWLLNIRGADVARTPILHGFAVAHDTDKVTLFTDIAKFSDILHDELFQSGVIIKAFDKFIPYLSDMAGPVRVDPTSAPFALSALLGDRISLGKDPCSLAKACKNHAEIAATRQAHLRDGAALVEFLHWLDKQEPETLSEIDIVTQLETFRHETNKLYDLSFDTICGSGPNGAIIHYRVTYESNRRLKDGDMLLIDSGAQYQDGTTDVTRSIFMGKSAISLQIRATYTRVLQGLIAISKLRFPKGLAGRDIDALARVALWNAGLDYDHGTGHGVGAFLSVHEGPQRISRLSELPLEEGMIVSNEPGYYREGAFGIRLENLIVVKKAESLGDQRPQYAFETLTFVPFSRQLIDTKILSPDEKIWLNHYHAQVLEKLTPRLSANAQNWLTMACAPL